MSSERFTLETGRRETVVDLTSKVEAVIPKGGSGLVNVYLPHATAGLALIEMQSGTEEDLMDAVTRLLPPDNSYAHSHGSRGHGASHVLPAFIAPTLTIPVIDGRLALGTWQRIALVDTNVDNPHREVIVTFVSQ